MHSKKGTTFDIADRRAASMSVGQPRRSAFRCLIFSAAMGIVKDVAAGGFLVGFSVDVDVGAGGFSGDFSDKEVPPVDGFAASRDLLCGFSVGDSVGVLGVSPGPVALLQNSSPKPTDVLESAGTDFANAPAVLANIGDGNW